MKVNIWYAMSTSIPLYEVLGSGFFDIFPTLSVVLFALEIDFGPGPRECPGGFLNKHDWKQT